MIFSRGLEVLPPFLLLPSPLSTQIQPGKTKLKRGLRVPPPFLFIPLCCSDYAAARLAATIWR